MTQKCNRLSAVLVALMILCPATLSGQIQISTSSNRTKSNASRKTTKSVPRSTILKMSRDIDALVQKQLEQKQEKWNGVVSDETFVRRAYLDIIGRIPTLGETRKFLDSKNKNKRQILIDDLLDSYGYVSRQYNFWADLLRAKSRVRIVPGQPYLDYIKDSLTENKPYDEFVKEMLVAEGPYMQKGNGAVGYYLRDTGMPEDNMSNTIRIFLGTRLECAQCHDHPFDKWTQKQYFEMVAFTGGIQFRNRLPDSENPRDIAQLYRNRDYDASLRPFLRRLVLPMNYGVSGNGTGLARLPENFLGKEGKEGDIVKASVIFGEQPNVDPRIPRTGNRKLSERQRRRNPQLILGARPINTREDYAEWLTDSSNPRFSTVIANRLWKQAFGLALIEPLDDINDQTVASNPALMKYLSEMMIQLDFDMKQFLRVVYNTRTYQSEATGKDVLDPGKYNFNGPVIRRMSAEQIWDTLLTLTVENIDKRRDSNSRRNPYLPGDDIYASYEELRKLSADEILDRAKQMSEGGRQMCQQMMAEQRKKFSKQRAKLDQERKALARQIRAAQNSGDQKKLKSLMQDASEMRSRYRNQRRNQMELYRASEIASPARPGHLLREFGQSDREAIENGNTEPAVTQVLTLMNGFLESQIAQNPNTVLMLNVQGKKSAKEVVDVVFLTLLNRKPSSGERRIWETDIRKNYREGVADMIWTLVNTNEFIFLK